MLSSQTAVAGLTPARLKLILGESNIENLTLPDGLPESLDDLTSKIKTTFRLKGNLNLQYKPKLTFIHPSLLVRLWKAWKKTDYNRRQIGIKKN